jgi:hypothetical protein
MVTKLGLWYFGYYQSRFITMGNLVIRSHQKVLCCHGNNYVTKITDKSYHGNEVNGCLGNQVKLCVAIDTNLRTNQVKLCVAMDTNLRTNQVKLCVAMDTNLRTNHGKKLKRVTKIRDKSYHGNDVDGCLGKQVKLCDTMDTNLRTTQRN